MKIEKQLIFLPLISGRAVSTIIHSEVSWNRNKRLAGGNTALLHIVAFFSSTLSITFFYWEHWSIPVCDKLKGKTNIKKSSKAIRTASVLKLLLVLASAFSPFIKSGFPFNLSPVSNMIYVKYIAYFFLWELHGPAVKVQSLTRLTLTLCLCAE